LKAAKAAGIETGGLAPRDWRTEAGPAPWLADFGLMKSLSASYQVRTRQNVQEADGTLIFEECDSPGTKLTWDLCERLKKPVRVVMIGRRDDGRLGLEAAAHTPAGIAEWIVEDKIAVLNVAGHRESVCPGIGAGVERYMAAVFRALQAGGAGEGR
jgi:hypothetical protein